MCAIIMKYITRRTVEKTYCPKDQLLRGQYLWPSAKSWRDEILWNNSFARPSNPARV